MLTRGVYAATLSLLNKDLSLNVEATVSHAENLIKQGLHGVFFFGSTGQSQLISNTEKKELISNILKLSIDKSKMLGKKEIELLLHRHELITLSALVIKNASIK